MESNEQQGIGIENESKMSKGNINFDQTGPTSKGGPSFPQLFRLDQADPFSFRLKLPDILFE